MNKIKLFKKLNLREKSKSKIVYEKLDKLLKYFYEKETYYHIDSWDVHNELKDIYDEKELSLLLQKLSLDKYITTEIKSEDKNIIDGRFYSRITFHGVLFFELGGYNSEKKANRLRTITNISKTIAIAANAIIIVIIAFAGVYVSYDSKGKDETINEKDKKIEILSARVDSLTLLQKENKTTYNQAPSP